MPTIDELAPATSVSDLDEFVVNQAGTSRKATRGQVIAGLQQEISLPNGSLLGRNGPGPGAPEAIAVGPNLTLANGVLSAAARPYVIASGPIGTLPAGADLVPVAQSGANSAVAYAQFMAGISNIPGIDASSMVVTPTGQASGVKLADHASQVLPLAGGSMRGPLTLAADPTDALQAATKQYADAKLGSRVSKAGDTMTGLLNVPAIATFQWGYAATDWLVKMQRAGSSSSVDTGVLHVSMQLTHSEGQPGLTCANAYFETSVANAYQSGVLVDGPATNHWSVGATLSSDAVHAAASNQQNCGSQHGALYAHAVKNLPQGGYPANKSGAQVWSSWFVLSDRTGLPSSKSGAIVANETDISCNGLDDADNRYGFLIALSRFDANGQNAELGRAFYTTTDSVSSFKRILDLGGVYNVAVLDARNAFIQSGKRAHTIWLKEGQDVAFDYDGNVQLFYDSSAQVQAVRVTSSLKVDSALTAGRLSSTGPANLAALTVSGQAQINGAVLVANAGDKSIYFSRPDGTAASQIVSSGSSLNLFTLDSTGVLPTAVFSLSPAGCTIGADLVAGNLTARALSASTITLQGPLNAGSYKTSALPPANPGAIAYAQDARKPGEGVGQGTGAPAFIDKTGRWISLLTGAPVVA